MDPFVALYLIMLAGIAGYVLIANVPSVLHTPLMSGSNFIHAIVLAGAMVALGHAENTLQLVIAFLAVVAATANAVGGYIVTDRMLAMFEVTAKRNAKKLERANAKQLEAKNQQQQSASVANSTEPSDRGDNAEAANHD